jgi:phosphatidylserine/phosphatidylglycerophosphate/cardiolipin synthase-like enzyme
MPFPKKAVAFANNDYVHVAWSFGDEPLAGCAGFALYRVAQEGEPQGVAVASFARDKDGKRIDVTTEDQPIPKYSWRDVFAKRGGTFRYRVVAMAGPKQPLAGVHELETELVTLTPKIGNAQVFFNRGILATQHTSDALWDPAKKKPDFAKIDALINDPASALRASLSGQHFPALTQLLDRAARDGGSCWASLYELTDQALIEKLAACEDLHLILSNNNADATEEQEGGPYDGKNRAAAEQLRGTAKELIRRYMPTGQIGHNKFVVYKDAQGAPRAVLTGSTNWTATGLCTQSNNAIVIESEELAAQYLAYWDALKADALAAGIPDPPAPVRAIQGGAFRTDCGTARQPIAFDGDSSVQVWFSPNTAKLLGKPPTPTPVDMSEVYAALHKAQQSVLFLAFMPGKAGSGNSLHFLKELGKVSTEKPWLFVRGAVSDPDLTREFDLERLRTEENEDSMIASPQGIFRDFEAWRKEIYKFGHAIIHDKVIVVDPFSADCVLIVGSHNLGFRASSNNDENMLILRGHQGVAQAYALHVMDVFEHYRSRWISANNNEKDYDPLHDPHWQERYFQKSKPAFAERLFWVSGGQALPPLKDNPLLKLGLAKEEKAEADRKAAAAARKAAKGGAPAASAKKAAAKKPAAKQPAAKKPAAKKLATKKPAAKKPAAKKPAAKKPAVKKSSAKKPAAKKAAKKGAAKKPAARKGTVKKAAAKKGAAKKSAAKKAPAKKGPAKKATAKKAGAKKTAGKKGSAKRAAAKRK